MTSLLILNVLLFLPAVLGGVGMCALGWILAGRGGEGGGSGNDGGQKLAPPVGPARPQWPVAPRATILRRDLARAA